MNEHEQAELGQLKERQQRLLREVELLSSQLRVLEERLNQPAPVPVATPAPLPEPAAAPVFIPPQPVKPLSLKAMPVPPPIPLTIAKTAPVPVGEPIFSLPAAQPAAQPEPVAALAAPSVAQEPSAEPAAIPVPPPLGEGRFNRSDSSTAPEPQAAPQPEAVPAPSLEMRLGTHWIPRVGIVVLLTGLVCLGNLAYQHYHARLGPGVRVTMLYLASSVLLGLGAWWQRRPGQEALKNYAQVLYAGGLAAVYFTTYAAYHLEPLKIIHSPLLDGTLLLGWAAFMVWTADRKKSQVLALFAIGLAYYTSVITRVGSFTLYSNLVLTLAAIFFMVRNRWALLTVASLFATYAGYGFWRFFDGDNWHWASPESGLWAGTYFLISYWLLFSAAVFLSKHEQFTAPKRLGFLTFNNGAFFSLFLLTMLQVHQGGFWKFGLIYGSALLGLALLARKLLADEPTAKNGYLTQGLLLVTVGIISHPKLAGLNLALVLAMESVTLLFLGQQQKNLILRIGAYIAAGLAVGWGIDGMLQAEPKGVWLAVGLGLLMLVDMFLVHRQSASQDSPLLRPRPSYFILLALLVWLVATWNNAPRALFPLVLALEALVLTFSYYLLRVRELPLLSQGYLVMAQAGWFLNMFDASPKPPWWNPALLLGITLGLSHWWQRQKSLVVERVVGQFFHALYALALVGVLYVWLAPQASPGPWLLWSSLLALALTAYGVLTRAWWVAAFGQLFLLASGAQFVLQLAQTAPPWHLALAPIGALSLLSLATWGWFAARPEADAAVRTPVLQVALLYRWVALAMGIWWICEYIPSRERIWLLALLGLWAFLWAGWRRNREALLFSAVFNAVALGLFWLPLLQISAGASAYWLNLIVILVLLAQRQLARRLPERYPLGPQVHALVIVLGGLSLWRFVSMWVLESGGGFYLTVSWSLLALGLFAAGILLRERVYRYLGLGILACSLGRVVVFDIWKLEALYRILSLMALGLVLLVLGFIYSKYQDKLRQWL